MEEHSKRPYKVFEADEDAVYDEEYTIDLSTLRPTIAFPHLPENTKTIDEITEDIVVDQAVIGSCTNAGRAADGQRQAEAGLARRRRDRCIGDHRFAGGGQQDGARYRGILLPCFRAHRASDTGVRAPVLHRDQMLPHLG